MATIKHLPNMRQGDDYTVELKYPAGTNITGFKFYLTLKASFDDFFGVFNSKESALSQAEALKQQKTWWDESEVLELPYVEFDNEVFPLYRSAKKDSNGIY